MHRACHIVLSMYGFWLPNDPRGSWSSFVGSWNLLRYGPARRVTTRRSTAGDPHDVLLRRAARSALHYPPVRLTGTQAQQVIAALGRVCQTYGLACYACAILPDHLHVVLHTGEIPVHVAVQQLKKGASDHLRERGMHPLAAWQRPGGPLPTMWARKYWKVYIDEEQHLQDAIHYVEANPIKEGLRAQRWSFVRSPWQRSGAPT